MALVEPMPAVQQPAVEKDLRTLASFVEVYCNGRHPHAPKQVMSLKSYDMQAIAGRPISLCDDCRKLLTHAIVKRSHCTMSPKPACKHCPVHCYHPTYRQQIREVMKYSGMKLLLSGRVDYLMHLLF